MVVAGCRSRMVTICQRWVDSVIALMPKVAVEVADIDQAAVAIFCLHPVIINSGVRKRRMVNFTSHREHSKPATAEIPWEGRSCSAVLPVRRQMCMSRQDKHVDEQLFAAGADRQFFVSQPLAWLEHQ